MTRFSVALCTHNGGLYLEEQLASIAAQSRSPDELIICDDCSTDSSLSLAYRFQESAPFPVRIFENSSRLGPTKNFEKAIGLSGGDVVALSDQDDVWMPHKLEYVEKMLAVHPEAGYVFSDALVTDETLVGLGYTMWEVVAFSRARRRSFARGCQLEVLLKGNVVTGATLAFNADVKGLVLPIPALWMHDGWIALVCSALGRSGVFIEEPLMYYRQHSDQTIGGVRLGPHGRFQRALSHEAGMHAQDRTRYHHALNHVIEMGAPTEGHERLFNGKLDHLAVRESLRERPLIEWIRDAAKELASGRYHSYSNGWTSVLKDMVVSLRHAWALSFGPPSRHK